MHFRLASNTRPHQAQAPITHLLQRCFWPPNAPPSFFRSTLKPFAIFLFVILFSILSFFIFALFVSALSPVRNQETRRTQQTQQHASRVQRLYAFQRLSKLNLCKSNPQPPSKPRLVPANPLRHLLSAFPRSSQNARHRQAQTPPARPFIEIFSSTEQPSRFVCFKIKTSIIFLFVIYLNFYPFLFFYLSSLPLRLPAIKRSSDTATLQLVPVTRPACFIFCARPSGYPNWNYLNLLVYINNIGCFFFICCLSISFILFCFFLSFPLPLGCPTEIKRPAGHSNVATCPTAIRSTCLFFFRTRAIAVIQFGITQIRSSTLANPRGIDTFVSPRFTTFSSGLKLKRLARLRKILHERRNLPATIF